MPSMPILQQIQSLQKKLILLFLLLPFILSASPKVITGIDRFLDDKEHYFDLLRGKRVGIITNHTAVNKEIISSRELIKKYSNVKGYKVTALFAPEHGLTGQAHAAEDISHSTDDGIPVFSLHGETRRPTDKMLKLVDLLIYDIQDIGSRSYTYITTLFYAMEEAAKKGIPVIVLDRPNPINGVTIDGPMLEDKWRSFVGYINVPYCHGMTIGELAQMFNSEYKVGCKLTVIPMSGWKREMSFIETGLTWIPTSPNIPEPTTPFYYPVTGLLGELQIVNIGAGFTMPFKIVGAPWIDAKVFAEKLNAQKFSGVTFLPYYFKPFYGRFLKENCQGVQIIVTDHLQYKPVSTQYLIIGMLSSLYPIQMKEGIQAAEGRKDMFCKVNGTDKIYNIIKEKENIVWKLRAVHQRERENFIKIREKYLLY